MEAEKVTATYGQVYARLRADAVNWVHGADRDLVVLEFADRARAQKICANPGELTQLAWFTGDVAWAERQLRGAKEPGGAAAERRLAPDGERYTQREFRAEFGGLAEWHAAAPAGTVQVTRDELTELIEWRSSSAFGCSEICPGIIILLPNCASLRLVRYNTICITGLHLWH